MEELPWRIGVISPTKNVDMDGASSATDGGGVGWGGLYRIERIRGLGSGRVGSYTKTEDTIKNIYYLLFYLVKRAERLRVTVRLLFAR